MTVVKYLFMHHKNVILAGTTVETSAILPSPHPLSSK